MKIESLVKVYPDTVEGRKSQKRDCEDIKRGKDRDAECAGGWLENRLKNSATHIEKISLRRDKTFDLPEDLTEYPLAVSQLIRTAESMDLSLGGLRQLAREISQKYQDLRFTFKLSPDGKWVEYSVKSQPISKNDMVIWEPDGIKQWAEPKKVIDIQNYTDGRKFAFFEGSKTGIPLDELTVAGS